jgi:hypothetical protein
MSTVDSMGEKMDEKLAAKKVVAWGERKEALKEP